jgi:hypothetical protein
MAARVTRWQKQINVATGSLANRTKGYTIVIGFLATLVFFPTASDGFDAAGCIIEAAATLKRPSILRSMSKCALFPEIHRDWKS